MYPSVKVLCGYEQFLFSTLLSTEAKLGMKLFPSLGVIIRHILHAHYQTNIWAQDTVAEPTMLAPVGLEWHEDDDGTYIPTVSDVSIAPEAVAELVKCSSAVSKCRVRQSCKVHILTCIKLCKCKAAEQTCTNFLDRDVQSEEESHLADEYDD